MLLNSTSNGYSQGVLTPLLWKMLWSTHYYRSCNLPIDVEVYADDMVVLAGYLDLEMVSRNI